MNGLESLMGGMPPQPQPQRQPQPQPQTQQPQRMAPSAPPQQGSLRSGIAANPPTPQQPSPAVMASALSLVDDDVENLDVNTRIELKNREILNLIKSIERDKQMAQNPMPSTIKEQDEAALAQMGIASLGGPDMSAMMRGGGIIGYQAGGDVENKPFVGPTKSMVDPDVESFLYFYKLYQNALEKGDPQVIARAKGALENFSPATRATAMRMLNDYPQKAMGGQIRGYAPGGDVLSPEEQAAKDAAEYEEMLLEMTGEDLPVTTSEESEFQDILRMMDTERAGELRGEQSELLKLAKADIEANDPNEAQKQAEALYDASMASAMAAQAQREQDLQDLRKARTDRFSEDREKDLRRKKGLAAFAKKGWGGYSEGSMGVEEEFSAGRLQAATDNFKDQGAIVEYLTEQGVKRIDAVQTAREAARAARSGNITAAANMVNSAVVSEDNKVKAAQSELASRRSAQTQIKVAETQTQATKDTDRQRYREAYAASNQDSGRSRNELLVEADERYNSIAAGIAAQSRAAGLDAATTEAVYDAFLDTIAGYNSVLGGIRSPEAQAYQAADAAGKKRIEDALIATLANQYSRVSSALGGSPSGQTALPTPTNTVLPSPANSDDLVVGQQYYDPNGRVGVWNGSRFVPVN